jgi:hypothetical protein
MANFTPSRDYSGSDSDTLDAAVFETLVPSFWEALLSGDARSSAVVLEADIESKKRQIAAMGALEEWIMGDRYRAQLAVMEAQLEVAGQQVVEAEITDAATIALYVGGALLMAIGVVAGVQGVVLLKEKTRSEKAARV